MILPNRSTFPWLHDTRVILALALLVLAPGCAPVPICAEAEAQVLYARDGGVFLGFTPEAAAQWAEVIRQEALGRCAYPKPVPAGAKQS